MPRPGSHLGRSPEGKRAPKWRFRPTRARMRRSDARRRGTCARKCSLVLSRNNPTHEASGIAGAGNLETLATRPDVAGCHLTDVISREFISGPFRRISSCHGLHGFALLSGASRFSPRKRRGLRRANPRNPLRVFGQVAIILAVEASIAIDEPDSTQTPPRRP